MRIILPLLAAMVMLPFSMVQGGTTAQTDLAAITVMPLTRQAGTKADWQTIYDYAGGALPPGTLVTSQGKWLDPIIYHNRSYSQF